jgi:hypothetical protein
LETPLHGRIGIDLHLGQKPKHGGEVRRRFTHLYIIFCQYFVYPCFAFFSLLLLFLFLLSKTQKKTKNISTVSLCLPL